ncbi:hypothetical protein ACVWYQ_004333 [Bradyrhizobium sp. USDA 3397]|nr:hypothetical protein [Bradyrhizobium yuanmingense]
MIVVASFSESHTVLVRTLELAEHRPTLGSAAAMLKQFISPALARPASLD